MRSSITLAFLHKGRPIRPNRQINITNDHPDITDIFSVEDALAAIKGIYELATGDFLGAWHNVEPLAEKAFAGKEIIVQKASHETFQQGGRIVLPRASNLIDELRVVFHAYSEDAMHKDDCFGVVAYDARAKARQVDDNGEQRSDHAYTRRFAIPLQAVEPGDYVFTFAAGDDGWLFDVAVSSVLTVTVAPPFSHQPTPGPVRR
jgi:hypothetical protein